MYIHVCYVFWDIKKLYISLLSNFGLHKTLYSTWMEVPIEVSGITFVFPVCTGGTGTSIRYMYAHVEWKAASLHYVTLEVKIYSMPLVKNSSG